MNIHGSLTSSPFLPSPPEGVKLKADITTGVYDNNNNLFSYKIPLVFLFSNFLRTRRTHGGLRPAFQRSRKFDCEI